MRSRRTATPDHVVVIGAGFAGLSAAMHLTGAGRRVTVLEAEAAPGGRAARVSLPAPGGGTYHLDTGPTVLTMPDLLADCFAALGESLSDWVTLRRLDPAYRAQFADGTGLSVTSDVDEMTERIRTFCGSAGSNGSADADADGYRRYVDFVTRLYRLQMRDFIDRNFDSPLDLVGASLAKLVALRGFSRLAPTVSRYFRDERLQRIFSFQAMYAGVSPARALAIYAVISYMDLVEGVSYPVGGMNALPTAMEAAARKAGVEFVYDTRVSSTTWRGDRVIEVQSLDGRTWSPDAIVMTPDRPAALAVLDRTPKHSKRGGRSLTGRPDRTRYSPSCVVLAAGVKAQLFPDAAHHTMHFGHAWSQVFDDLEAGRLMRDPSFLVSLPSVTDPRLAPAGRNTAYLLFPAPNLDHGQPLDWARLRGPYREHMLNTAERAGYRGLGDAIEAEELITPQDWADRGLGAGTPFAAAHTFGQTGPFRSPNTLGDNVAFAGSSTTPGVGVPMVLISGRLAAERLTGRNPAYRSLAWR